MRIPGKSSLAALLAIVAGSLAWANADEFEMTRSTIDGGGIMQSTGGSFELSGTIGQPDAGFMSGGSFDLTGGFWFAVEPADCNEDGFVGLSDHADFFECLSGPGLVSPRGCECFDLNRNGTVDLFDFRTLQATFASP